jgi:hypothetical protein
MHPENLSTKTVNVYKLVRTAAEKFNLPLPKIVISNTMLPNAAASGPSPKHGVVLITTGLLGCPAVRGADLLAGAAFAIGEISRDKQFVFTAFFHQLNTLGPSFDYLISLEGDRFSAFI